jgi:hypothetical protein
VFVVTVVLVANLSTREIQNTPSLRYIERKETALERERSPELSYIPVSPWWPTSPPGRYRTHPPSATSRGRKQH